MAAAIPRSLFTLSRPLPFSLLLYPKTHLLSRRSLFSSSISSRNTNSTASFDWSDDDDERNPDTKTQSSSKPKSQIDKSKLPPPYDPFSKKPIITEPKDPSNLQQVFNDMRSQGLFDNAVKMFDFLSQQGLTHEAMSLFSLIKDKGAMPDVVAHTAVIEAYANAGGQSKQAIKTFEKMLACGVLRNVYTYSVLIRGLAKDGVLGEARRLLMEMVGNGMRVDAGTYVRVFEALVREEKAGEGRELLREMRSKGFEPSEKEVRDKVDERGPMFRSIMNLLFGKYGGNHFKFSLSFLPFVMQCVCVGF